MGVWLFGACKKLEQYSISRLQHRSNEEDTVIAVLHFPVVGLAVFMKGLYRHPHHVLFNIGYPGGEFSHFATVAFFYFRFSFDMQ